jgi:hypothetical protein
MKQRPRKAGLCLAKRALFLTSLLSLELATAHAQEPLGTFPYQRDGQLILVEVSVDEHAPALFVLDSGAPHTVLDPKFAKELGLDVKHALPTTGTGLGNVGRSYGKSIVLKLHNVKIDVPQPWIIDLSKVPIPPSVTGLVGAELFTEYVVRMDPLRSTFDVFDPASYTYRGDGMSLPLVLDDGKLFLEAELEVPAGHRVTHKLRIDTGSESSINDEIVKQSTELRSSTLGKGLGEDFKSYSGVFTSVRIGHYSINRVWGPAGHPPSIGMELLRRFVITFDAPHGRIYLEPTPALAEPVPTPPTSPDIAYDH